MSSYGKQRASSEGLERFSGVAICKPGVSMNIQTASADKGPTYFRIYPEISEAGVELPQFQSADPFDWSCWMKFEKYVRNAGVNGKFTCLTRTKILLDKGTKHRIGNEVSAHEVRELIAQDKVIEDLADINYSGPLEYFFQNLYWGIKKSPGAFPPEWTTWIDKKGAALPRVDAGGLLQGILIQQNGKAQPRGGDGYFSHPVLMMLTKTAREELENMCKTEVPNYRGRPDDYPARFVSGDLVSCQSGCPISIVLKPGTGREVSQYQIVSTRQVFPLPVQLVARDWKPWDKFLNYLTEQEQLDMLCRYFPPEAVDYIFQGTVGWRSMLPPQIQGAFIRRGAPVATPAITAPQPGQVAGSPAFQPPPAQAAAAPGWAPPPGVAPGAPVWGAPPPASNGMPLPPSVDAPSPAFSPGGFGGAGQPPPFDPGVSPPVLSGPPFAAPAPSPSVPAWTPPAATAAVPWGSAAGGQPVWQNPQAAPPPAGPVLAPAASQPAPLAFGQPGAVNPPGMQPIGDPAQDQARMESVRRRLADARAKADAANAAAQAPAK